MMRRLFDISIAVLLFVVMSPCIVIIFLSILFKLGMPVFFKQVRIGRYGKQFTLIKFRTMINSFDRSGKLSADAERLTGFGKFLRHTSLDELPELWNVIKGDMSIVGPRPLLPEYLPLYTPEQVRRHHVRPGITGWAQINGRNLLNWEEKFRMDVWYVDNRSFLLDLKIMFVTLKKVLGREGISQNGHVTMEKFKGSCKKI